MAHSQKTLITSVLLARFQCIIILISLLIFSTCFANCCQEIKTNNYPITKTFCLPEFDSIVISGDFQVEIFHGPEKISASGTKEALSHMSLEVKRHTLYLYLASAPKDHINIKLCACHLKSIVAKKFTDINCCKCCFSCLNVEAYDNSSIYLEGDIKATNIHQRGNGKIEMAWIDSNKLVIDSTDTGPIYLAGVAKDMFVDLRGQSFLDARYLRTCKAVVLTKDIATAHIYAIRSFSAYAEGHSNIFFYNRPKYFTVVTKESGNVLKGCCN